jgi:hypothetical protein
MARAELEAALRDAGDDPAHTAHLRRLLAAELDRSRTELAKPRSGREERVTVAFADGLFAIVPVDAAMRVDTNVTSERGQQLVAAVFEALGEAGEAEVMAGEMKGFLALHGDGGDTEVAALAFDEAIEGVDRLKAGALVVPSGILDVRDLRTLASVEAEHEIRPHEDPDPARRVARRILQRLRGMGKWGGYHTEFRHLARGFEGNDLALAMEVGEALVAAGLLSEKPSVGQRHVCLNPRRAADIHRLIDEGTLPPDLTL